MVCTMTPLQDPASGESRVSGTGVCAWEDEEAGAAGLVGQSWRPGSSPVREGAGRPRFSWGPLLGRLCSWLSRILK